MAAVSRATTSSTRRIDGLRCARGRDILQSTASPYRGPPIPKPARPMTPEETTRTPRGNRFCQTYTYDEAWDILCAAARRQGVTPSRLQIPHVRAVVHALGCATLVEAQEHVGLIPNTRGPVQSPLPDGWTGDRRPKAPDMATDLDAERTASLARQRRRRAEQRLAAEPRRIPAPRGDDFAEPADLAAEPPAWWAA